MNSVFDKDIRSQVFHEDSALTGPNERRHKLKDFDEINQIFRRSRRPLIVAEPKLQSHLARTFLAEIPQSTMIWMFRHFKDAVFSKLLRFSSQIANLIPILNNDPHNWRSQGVSAETRSLVTHFYSPNMTRADAAALLWYVRNMLIFEYDLHNRPDVILCKYEDFSRDSSSMMRAIYGSIGLSYPGDVVVKHINANNIGIGKDIKLSSDVGDLCASLLRQLDHCKFSANKRDVQTITGT